MVTSLRADPDPQIDNWSHHVVVYQMNRGIARPFPADVEAFLGGESWGPGHDLADSSVRPRKSLDLAAFLLLYGLTGSV